MPRLLAATCAVLLLASPAAAQPRADDTTDDVTPTTADEWLALGLERYEAGDWKGAVEAFQRGHELDPRPQFLFAIAQAERRRGNCKAAVVYYDRFLATSPPPAQEQAATTQLRRCESAIAKERLEKPEPAPRPAAPEPAPLPPPAPPSPPWYTDGATVATGGVSAALLLTGGAFLLAADGAATEAAEAPTYGEYADLKQRAETRQTIAIATLSVGAIVGGYAIYRIVRGRPARREAPQRVQVQPGPGVGLALGGSF